MKTQIFPKLLGVAILIMALARPAAFAGNVSMTASNSSNYVSDLQNKQESVASIKEDPIIIEKELLKKLNESGVVSAPRGQFSRLELPESGLSELMPVSGQALNYMGKPTGALQPKPSVENKKK